MELFNSTSVISICLKNKNKYVRLAVEDMRRDFRRISESCLIPEIIFEENGACIVIEENKISDSLAATDENFSIKSEKDKIRITADSYLGTMWGIYTFCEKILGVAPDYLFNDLEIVKKATLETDEIDITEKPDGFGFRGIFINDEDLLTAWKDGGGLRKFDFQFYSITVEESVMKMVVETALRLKFNLVIPASFLNIDNPPEKLLADCVAERGIYITQHHLEPVGVSAFTFKNYCKKNNISADFSYKNSPEIMEKVWEHYAEKWAQYDNVVWQIGLRGEGDRPVWQDKVPTEEDFKESGNFISNAYKKQKEIILKATSGKAKYFTSTLWMEGGFLLEKGYLEFPKDTMVVFADTGVNQMYSREYYDFGRDAAYKYGIYYHLQYYGSGPHLAPQTGLDKLHYNLKTAFDKGDNSYLIMNVSNVREFVFEICAYSQMAWNINSFSKEGYLREYCKKFGRYKEEAQKLIEEYYNALPFLKAECLSKHCYSKFFNFYTEEVEGIKNYVIKEGEAFIYGRVILSDFKREINGKYVELCREYYYAIKKAIPNFEKCARDFEALAEKLDEPFKKHLKVKWLLFSKTMLYIYSWYVNLFEAKLSYDEDDVETFKKNLNSASKALYEYLTYRKVAEYGNFENWYRGDIKMDVGQLYLSTKKLLGQTPDFGGGR